MEKEPYYGLITGFEPFMQHRTNPSWFAVKSLSKHPNCYILPLQPASTEDENSDEIPVLESYFPTLPENAHLVVKELPVRYKPVQSLLPRLEHLNPEALSKNGLPHNMKPFQFILHVGVGHEGPICLEQRARNRTYVKLDNDKETPHHGTCIEGGPETIYTKVNLEELKSYLQQSTNVDIIISNDAGLYLCEFTYFTSLATTMGGGVKDTLTLGDFKLDVKCDNVLFMHLPPVGHPYSLLQMQKVIWSTVEYLCHKYDVNKYETNGKSERKTWDKLIGMFWWWC